MSKSFTQRSCDGGVLIIALDWETGEEMQLVPSVGGGQFNHNVHKCLHLDLLDFGGYRAAYGRADSQCKTLINNTVRSIFYFS